MKKIFLLFYILFFTSLSFADALPHGYQAYQFEGKSPDSIIVIESDDIQFKERDTVYYNPNVKVVECSNNNCYTSGHGRKKYQQVIIFSEGKRFLSNIYEPEGSNPTFVVKEKNNQFTVIETTSFLFRGKTGEILRALIITLFLELLIALLFFRLRNNSNVYLVIVILNLITIPLAWFTFPIALEYIDSVIPLTLAFELLIVIVEFLGLKILIKNYSTSKILGFVVTANLISFVIGGIAFVFTIFL